MYSYTFVCDDLPLDNPIISLIIQLSDSPAVTWMVKPCLSPFPPLVEYPVHACLPLEVSSSIVMLVKCNVAVVLFPVQRCFGMFISTWTAKHNSATKTHFTD